MKLFIFGPQGLPWCTLHLWVSVLLLPCRSSCGLDSDTQYPPSILNGRVMYQRLQVTSWGEENTSNWCQTVIKLEPCFALPLPSALWQSETVSSHSAWNPRSFQGGISKLRKAAHDSVKSVYRSPHGSAPSCTNVASVSLQKGISPWFGRILEMRE